MVTRAGLRVTCGSKRLIRTSKALTHGSKRLIRTSKALTHGSKRLICTSKALTHGSKRLICTSKALTHGLIGRSRTCVRVIRRVAASLRNLLNLKRHPPLAVRSKLQPLCLDDPGCSRRAQPPDAESRMSGGVGGLTGAIRSAPPDPGSHRFGVWWCAHECEPYPACDGGARKADYGAQRCRAP